LDRFSSEYNKPVLIDIAEASLRGWTQVCSVGNDPRTHGSLVCTTGNSVAETGNDFLRSEMMQNDQSRSGILGD
jgi:hypothetical protein